MKIKNLKQFERYYNGEMDGEEKSAFESLLAKDRDFQAQYQEYLNVHSAIAESDTLDLRMKLKEIRAENQVDKPGGESFTKDRSWIWLAALIAVVLGFSSVIVIMVRTNADQVKYSYSINSRSEQGFSSLNAELQRYELRDGKFRLIAPTDSNYLDRRNPLHFAWEVETGEPLIIDLLDWSGKTIYSSGKPVFSPHPIEQPLPEGFIAYRFRTDHFTYRIGMVYLK